LIYPDYSKEFILNTDASNQALGAVLGQVINGVEHPIAYASRQLNSAEQNYTVTERELLAVVWAVKYFRCYLYGRTFTLYTDHSAIKWLLSLKDPSSRLTRWALKLAEYDYKVIHKPGIKNQNADCLSRIVLKTKCESLPLVDLDILKEKQRNDNECQKLKKYRGFKTNQQGIIYFEKGSKRLIVVPKDLREKIIRLHHDIPTAGHGGIKKTMFRIQGTFYWPKMKEDVNTFIRTCDACCKRSDYGKNRAPLGSFQEPTEFAYRLSCDIVGPMPLTRSSNKYILTVIDHFTRFGIFIALPDQTAETIAQALIHRVFTKIGIPMELITDQGSNFTSDLIKNVCSLLKIRKLQTTAYHAMANGRTEIVHKTIPKMLSHYVNRSQSDWDEFLPMINMAYNSQVHDSTGFSPYEMVYGKEMRTPLEADLTLTDDREIYSDYVEDLRFRMSKMKEISQECQTKARQMQKKQYDKKSKEVKYKVGQLVYLHVPHIKKGRTKKLSRLWRGPYKIVEVKSSLNVVLRIRARNVVVHVNRIKPVIVQDAEEEEGEEQEAEEDKLEDAREDAQEPASHEGLLEPTPAEEQEGPESIRVEPSCSHIPDAQDDAVDTQDAGEREAEPPPPRSRSGRPRRVRKGPLKYQDYDMS